MDADDLRSLLAPLAVVAGARPRYRLVPASSTTPPATPEDPDPEPIVTPARTEVYTEASELPDAITPDGVVDLGGQLALLHAAVAQLWADLEIRTVLATRTLTSGVYLAGTTFELNPTWDSAPLRTPTGPVLTINAYVGWMGRTTARVTALSDAGCTVLVTVLSTVAPTSSQPLGYEVTGQYFYVPGAIT